MNEEPSDDECRTVAMLTGYYFQERFRYMGRKFLQRREWKTGQGHVAQRYVEYLDPLTLEVIGENTVADHYEMLNRSYNT